MKTHYILNIVKIVALAIAGLLIAQLFGSNFPLFMDSQFLTYLLFAGLPFGWLTLRKVFGGIIVFGIWGILIHILLSFIGAMVVGWAIMLFQLGSNILGLVLVKKEIAEFRSPQ